MCTGSWRRKPRNIVWPGFVHRELEKMKFEQSRGVLAILFGIPREVASMANMLIGGAVVYGAAAYTMGSTVTSIQAEQVATREKCDVLVGTVHAVISGVGVREAGADDIAQPAWLNPNP